MNPKALAQLETEYMRALSYAVVYGCTLSVEQFAAAHALDPDELEQLRAQLQKHGVNV
jgi:hypothetical protein